MAMTKVVKQRWRRAGIAAAMVLGGTVVVSSTASAATVYEYSFTFANGATRAGSSSSDDVVLTDAGGSSATDPAGVKIKLNCDDTFPGGWGSKEGPKLGIDSAWQLDSYTITKYKDGNLDKTCNGHDLTTQMPAGDYYDYTFTFVNGTTITGLSRVDNPILSDAGGSSATDPTGVKIKLNCDDTFPGGWGSKEGPKLGIDSAWQLDSYTITKYKDGNLDKTCNGHDLTTQMPAGDYYNYTFTFVNGTTITGISPTNVAFVADAGGPDVDQPTGMNLHVSCSDPFPGGWGEKDGPKFGIDTAWQLESYQILKYKDGNLDKSCADSFVPPEPPGVPAIDVEMSVNAADADLPPGPESYVGSTATFAYVVTNVGETLLADVRVEDVVRGHVSCPRTTLAAGESMSCSSTTVTLTTPGPRAGGATVTATAPSVTYGVHDPIPTTGSGIVYSFAFRNGTSLSGIGPDNNTLFLAGAGGSSAVSPSGMNVHVSCSDSFPNGWGEKDGPKLGVDTAWQLASYALVKFKDGVIDRTCVSPTLVTDSDPVYYRVIDAD